MIGHDNNNANPGSRRTTSGILPHDSTNDMNLAEVRWNKFFSTVGAQSNQIHNYLHYKRSHIPLQIPYFISFDIPW
ncbi:hypothetical protein HanIR_Chr14g0692421 [Helianthus annuus]|nr:hypothetical protein HanIR_Chr14g0692421 [Helianthus annuus]